jgi:hypothetical protein
VLCESTGCENARLEVTKRPQPRINSVTAWHTLCNSACPPGMPLHSPASFASIPLACAALWLTSAVANAQQVNQPGLPAAHAPAAVSQVAQPAKPAVSQVAKAASTQTGNSALSQAAKQVAPQSPPPAVPQAATAAATALKGAASSAAHAASTATNAAAATAQSHSAGTPPPSAAEIVQQAVASASSATISPQQAAVEVANAVGEDASTAVTSTAESLAVIPGPTPESADDADPPLPVGGDALPLTAETGPAVKQAINEAKAAAAQTVERTESAAKPTLQQVQSTGEPIVEQVEMVAVPVADQAQAAAGPIVEQVEMVAAPVIDQVQSLTEPIDGAVALIQRDVSDVIGIPSVLPGEPIVAVLSEPGAADRPAQPQTAEPAEREPARGNYRWERQSSPTQGEYETLAASANLVRSAAKASAGHGSTQPQRLDVQSADILNRPTTPRAQPRQVLGVPTEADKPAQVEQFTHPSEWARLFAAHLLAFDDLADELRGLRHTSQASIRLTPAHGATAIEAWLTRSTPSAPAPYTPANPSSQLPVGATAAPASTSGGISLSGGGSHGGAPPLLADLALATAWRPLWHQATLRPTGIVLPNLAPPG